MTSLRRSTDPHYAGLVKELSELLEAARRASARAVNVLMTTTYWEIGHRIVEYEQKGERRARYGAQLLRRISGDLTARFGRGFSERNLEQMRKFYLGWQIPQTLSAESSGTRIAKARLIARRTPSWHRTGRAGKPL